MENYALQVEEFQDLGDIEEIFRYQRKAQGLENKLVSGMEKIDKFNEEENAYGWPLTQYPMRKEIADRLAPYKKLYDVGCEFLTKHDKWISSTIGSYYPEDIDNDVSTAYR